MIYSQPLLWQLYNFLFFFGFGFLCGFLFRLVEFFRELFSSKKAAVIAQDIVFSVLSTVLMFVFLLTYADGKVRLNLIFAAALGAAVFFLTIGSAVQRVFCFLSTVLRKTVLTVSKPFLFLAAVIKRLLSKLVKRFSDKAAVLKTKKEKNGEQKAPQKSRAAVFKKRLHKKAEKKNKNT